MWEAKSLRSPAEESSVHTDYAAKALAELGDVREQSYRQRDPEKRVSILLGALEHINAKRIKNR